MGLGGSGRLAVWAGIQRSGYPRSISKLDRRGDPLYRYCGGLWRWSLGAHAGPVDPRNGGAGARGHQILPDALAAERPIAPNRPAGKPEPATPRFRGPIPGPLALAAPAAREGNGGHGAVRRGWPDTDGGRLKL